MTIKLDNEHHELSTISGLLDQLSAIDLETKCDALLPIFVELAARLEILREVDELDIYEFKHALGHIVDGDVAE